MPISKSFYCPSYFLARSSAHHAGVPCLNIKFSPKLSIYGSHKNALSGPGIYGLCFREDCNVDATKADWRLIYIGRYLGENGNLYSGDIANVRWWKHLATITMRGDRVSVRPKPLLSLPPTFPLVKMLNCAKPKIHSDNGCVSSKNRMTFAINNWGRFGGSHVLPSKLLVHFKFFYSRFDPSIFPAGRIASAQRQKRIDDHIRKCIKAQEKVLIQRFGPVCNFGQKINNTLSGCQDAGTAIEKAIQCIERSSLAIN